MGRRRGPGSHLRKGRRPGQAELFGSMQRATCHGGAGRLLGGESPPCGVGWGGGLRPRWASGPAAERRRRRLLAVPAESSTVVGGKWMGFALCRQRMWPTPSQQARLAEQQKTGFLNKNITEDKSSSAAWHRSRAGRAPLRSGVAPRVPRCLCPLRWQLGPHRRSEGSSPCCPFSCALESQPRGGAAEGLLGFDHIPSL